MSQHDTAHAWWSRLRHQGLLLSPVVMLERFPDAPQQPPFPAMRKLKDAHTRFQAKTGDGSRSGLEQATVLEWADSVLQDYVGHTDGRFARQHSIPANLTAAVRIGSRTETLRPHRVVFADQAGTWPALLVMADTSAHVGRGRGRTAYARFLELLRGTGQRLGLLTNGLQFRLIYVGLDFESWCEWESDRWFDEDEGSEELAGLRQLLSPESLKPVEDETPALLAAVAESRTKQADLSRVLKENVRLAVELLLEEVSAATRSGLLPSQSSEEELSDGEAHEALLQAAVRVVMRLVVCLFAESRGLLPVDDPVYAQSYGVRSLYELLEEAVRHEGSTYGLANRHAAWPRLKALFRLIHGGSAHGAFPMYPYNGLLFRPGQSDHDDPVSRALSILEHSVRVSDGTVHRILRKLLRGPLPVLRGRTPTSVEGPVDYTELRTEFIGLIYEGLLDYKLKRTDDATGPIVFLRIGREPVLPLKRLEDMLASDPTGLRDLLTKLKKEKVTAPVASGEGDDDSDEEDADEGEEAESEENVEIEVESEEAGEGTPPEQPAVLVDADHRARKWAREAVLLAGMARKKRKKEPESDYQIRIDAEAAKLIKPVVAAGEFYLVRAGNTRKGTGTFYTRPQLAVPTVHHTLRPLCYIEDHEASGKFALSKDGKLLLDRQGRVKIIGAVPKTPEEILSLKVCDPACGSASFLVAALHYITQALYASLCHHRGLEELETARQITLPYGKPRTGANGEELVPFPSDDPESGEGFEGRVKAILRRHVVERCIYGVDINRLAVEFARVSLWIETMDPGLPMTFLDHKIKVGNSLVGCWLTNILDYPIKAWQRNGGDDPSDKVEGPRTDRINTFLKGPKTKQTKRGVQRTGDGVIKQEMRSLIEQRFRGQATLFPELEVTPLTVVADARRRYEKLHELPVTDPEAREEHYRRLESDPTVNRLKRAMDEWCAVWFWPMDEESVQHVPTPAAFHVESPERDAIVNRLKAELHFFHWEVEFPDVFTPDRHGFDGVVGNPPWDTVQQESMEFFSEYDPIYRTYGKQAALARQEELFGLDPGIKTKWDEYRDLFAALNNWVKNCADPFSVSLARGKAARQLRSVWDVARSARIAGFTVAPHPFKYQGRGKTYTYKLFLECAYALTQFDGRLGMIVPSGLYSDAGTHDLRELFLEKATWEWLFGFENRKKIFDIHGSYKFAPTIVDRRKTDRPLRAAFMVRDLSAWDRPDPPVFDYDLSLIPLFSPGSKALPEVRTQRDLEICRKIYEHSVRIGDKAPGWEITYAQEFNMTTDSKLFPPLEKWEKKAYKPDVFGRWVGPDGDIALPVYVGKMIEQFDFCYKGWISGKGRSSKWRLIPNDDKKIEPEYLMSLSTFRERISPATFKVALMDITTAVHHRTGLFAVVPDCPCSHLVPVLGCNTWNLESALALSAILNSPCLDFVTRRKIPYLHLSWFVLQELPLPSPDACRPVHCDLLTRALRLTMIHRVFAPHWLRLRQFHGQLRQREWKHWWAVTEADRLRLRVEVDALCADLYVLEPDDFDWIVRDDPSDPKGFFRVDKDLPFRERLTGLAAAAFRALKEGKWSTESVGELSNDEFFELLGVPELTNAEAAKAKGLDEPLICKRKGCHVWKPEDFTPDDPRYGWTWDDCWKDAVALLGSEEAVEKYVKSGKVADDDIQPSSPDRRQRPEQTSLL